MQERHRIHNKKFADYDPSITSYLCTDDALKIFKDGGAKLFSMVLNFRTAGFQRRIRCPRRRRSGCSPTRSASTKRNISSNTSKLRVIAPRRTSFDGGAFGRSEALHLMK